MNSLAALFLLATFNNPCVTHYEQRAGIDLQTGAFSDGECYVSVSESAWRGMVYRDYMFTSDGGIMAFNSFGSGPNSTHTGARVIYLRPFTTQLGWRFNEENDLEVLQPSGAIARFDGQTGEWVELSGADLAIDPEVNRSNQGGVEIRSHAGYTIDSGFRFGGHPNSIMTRASTITSADGRRCEVENKELFHLVGDEHMWNFENNEEFTAWFDRRCP